MKTSTTDGKIILIAEAMYDENPSTDVKPEQILVIDTLRKEDAWRYLRW